MAYFQEGITTARQRLAEGQEVGGVLGRMVSAQDEEGNRCGCVCVASGQGNPNQACGSILSCGFTIASEEVSGRSACPAQR